MSSVVPGLDSGLTFSVGRASANLAPLEVNAVAAPGLVWQHLGTGQRSIWHMNGTAWNGQASLLQTVDAKWKIAASADFDGDGDADLVWQHAATGDRSIWLMDGTAWKGAYALLPRVAVQWEIAAAADFTGDNKPDLVWQNVVTGDRSMWHMNGASWPGGNAYTLLPKVAPEWRIAAAADFTGDNRPDLVWQHAYVLANGQSAGTGQRSIWHMNGTRWPGGNAYTLLQTVPTPWKIVAAADFTGDNRADLVWQNTSTGERSIWHMKGAAWGGEFSLLPKVNPQWQIAAHFGGGAVTLPQGSRIEIVSGSAQRATVATTLPESLAVRLSDGAGKPIAGVLVTWSTQSGMISQASATTSAAGVAKVKWTLGRNAGPATAAATVAGVGSVAFQATGAPDVPAVISFSISGLSGDPLPLPERAVVGQALYSPNPYAASPAVTAYVADRFGNPTPGVPVTWSTIPTDGWITPGSETGADGRAYATWYLSDTPGENVLRAEAGSASAQAVVVGAVPSRMAIVDYDGIPYGSLEPVEIGRYSVEFFAIVYDEDNLVISDVPLGWYVQHPEVAHVSSDGLSSLRSLRRHPHAGSEMKGAGGSGSVISSASLRNAGSRIRGTAQGTTLVTLFVNYSSWDYVSASISVTVNDPIRTLEIDGPSTVTVAVGDSVHLHATAYDEAHQPLSPYWPSGFRHLQWSVYEGTSISVDQPFDATQRVAVWGVEPGTSVVEVHYDRQGGYTDYVTIEVVPAIRSRISAVQGYRVRSLPSRRSPQRPATLRGKP